MKLYNTMTRRVEPFRTHIPGKVAMYTCGPTVYHYAHIGNLRSYICEDILEKTLRYLGYDVKRVMNITDVGHLSSDADTGNGSTYKVEICIDMFGFKVNEPSKSFIGQGLHALCKIEFIDGRLLPRERHFTFEYQFDSGE